jgi:hypothetical protein
MIYGWSRVWDKEGKGPDHTESVGQIKVQQGSLEGTLSSTLHKLGYVPSKGDPDAYLHTAVKPNGAQYYEMLLVYVDDILHVTHHKHWTRTRP